MDIYNAVKTTTASTGTGNMTVSATPAARSKPLSTIPTGKVVALRIEDLSGADWEISMCTILSATTFSRGTVLAGSNGTSKVNFGAGTKSVLHTLVAEQIATFLTSDSGVAIPTYLAANPGSTVSSGDTVLMVQGTAVVGEPVSALAAFAIAQYPTGKSAAVRVTAASTFPLDATTHNRRRVIVTASGVTINAPSAYSSVGDDFECDIINLSGAVVTIGSGISCLPAGSTIPVNGVAQVFSSAGVIYCMLPVASVAGVAPGQVTGLATSAPTSSGLTVTYAAPSTGTAPFSYTIQYRITGQTSWVTAATGVSALNYAITGLTPATGYDTQVCAVNSGGAGAFSATATGTTSAGAPAIPGQVTGLTAGTPTTTTVPLTWTAPSSGGAVASYTVQYRAGTTGTWLTFATGLTGLTSTVAGLSAATAYQFQVFAVNATGPGTASTPISATTAASGGGSPGVAPFTAAARANFPTAKGTFTSDFWWHDVTATGAATITSINAGLSQSNTIAPTSAISMASTVKGYWFGPMENYGGGTSYITNSNGSPVNTSVSPSLALYFWIIIEDSDGNIWNFCHSAPTTVGDSVTSASTTTVTSTPQVQS